jgi:hypothetical protein
VKVTVPNGVGEWIVRQDDGGDVVQRTRPVNPYLSVLFSVPEGKSTGCTETLAAFAKKGLKKLDRPQLVPAGWSTQVLTAGSAGERLVAFCAQNDDDGRQLVALVTYAANVDGPDLASVTPILESVGKAVFAAPKPKPPAPATPPSRPGPAAPDAEDDAPLELTLPRSGLVLLVGGGQKWEAKPGKGGRDLVRRTGPEEPTLSVALEFVRASHEDTGGCSAILDQYMATRTKSSLSRKPGYLPDEFHPTAAESYDRGTGRALTCAEVPSGYVLATIAYSGSLDAEDARAARPVLTAAFHAASATTAVAAHHGTDGWLTGHAFHSPEVFLGGEHTRTADPASNGGAIGAGNGVTGGVRQAGMWPFTSFLGLAGRYQLQGGWDSQNDLFFDGTLALGIGIRVDRITLMPMVGGGGDAIGAGAKQAADKLNLSFDLYNYYGGVAVVQLTDLLAVELTYGYCDRGKRRELRYDGKVIALPKSFRKVSVGLSYVDIERTATLWQLVLGVGF